MQKSDEVIAILCSDLHLSHKPPLCRADEPNWYQAMANQLDQLNALKAQHNVPIICAGDVFDKWNSPPELINFAMLHLPKMFAVPGQHDLPHHNYDDIRKSAYWTMVQCGKISNLEPGKCRIIGLDLVLYGFPFGETITPLESDENVSAKMIHLAVIHKYCWMGRNKYQGATTQTNCNAYRKLLQGYDAAVFGDNHSGFLSVTRDRNILNCGGFMRRRIDEMDYKPSVGLLRRDGSITLHFLDIEKDILTETNSEIQTNDSDFRGFIGKLNTMYDLNLDFEKAVRHFLKDHTLKKETIKQIHNALKT